MKEITITQQVPETWEELCKLAVTLRGELFKNLIIFKYSFGFDKEGAIYTCENWVYYPALIRNRTIAQMWAIMQALEVKNG